MRKYFAAIAISLLLLWSAIMIATSSTTPNRAIENPDPLQHRVTTRPRSDPAVVRPQLDQRQELDDPKAQSKSHTRPFVAADDQALAFIKFISAKGYFLPDQMELPAIEDWRSFERDWRETYESYSGYMRDKHNVGCAIADKRMKSGDFSVYNQSDYPAPSPDEIRRGIVDRRPWIQRTPNFIRAEYSFDKATGQNRVKVIEIKEGQDPKYDEAIHGCARTRRLLRTITDTYIGMYESNRKQ
ncbi:MAG: hypothetical protein H6718_00050 [Polyangiaceae bacterium]|nr:hypothetical protein [Polyangiaceae bacterium]